MDISETSEKIIVSRSDTELSELKKKFPPNFPADDLPAGAKEEKIAVYRICKSGNIEPSDFIPTYLEELSRTKENDGEEHDIGFYSLSTFIDAKDARKILAISQRKNPHPVIAKGTTDPSCGLCQRTKERKKRAKSHVDWWLYQDAVPHIFFQEADLGGDESDGDSKSVL